MAINEKLNVQCNKKRLKNVIIKQIAFEKERRGCGQKVGHSRGLKEEVSTLFTYEKKHRALQLYEQTHSVTETIRILGYPERATLYRWISEKGQPKKVRLTKCGENTGEGSDYRRPEK